MVLLALALPTVAFASSIPHNAVLVGEYQASGLYNLVGLETWNGQPLSPTNQPDALQRELASTIRLYVPRSTPNQLFITVSNVTTTIGAFWFGTAFDNVTQTGVSLNTPTFLGSATLDSNFALPGQTLVNGTSGHEVVTPLSHTPGYQLGFAGAQYNITTITGAQYGFTSLSNITGAIRIRGGGVFDLVFAPNTNLFKVDFRDLTVDTLYGNQGTNQSIQAKFVPAAPVPEPSTLLSFGTGVLALAEMMRRRLRLGT